ncbi:MAG: hypothetical protein ACI9GW_003518, partial [Halieaceae bacterium]
MAGSTWCLPRIEVVNCSFQRRLNHENTDTDIAC